MSNINGLSIKKVRSFVGPEGHVYQGDLYLGKKKIAFWSQDANGGIEDHLTMEPEYSEAKLRKAIIAANSDKAIVLHPNGSIHSPSITTLKNLCMIYYFFWILKKNGRKV